MCAATEGGGLDDRVRATYLLETGYPLDRAAQAIAGEQSSGTFITVPGETAELRERAGARVERITELQEVGGPTLPGAGSDGSGRWRRGEIEISWPLANFGPSLPNLLATIAGNLFELREVSGLRLLDVHLPAAFVARTTRPAVRCRRHPCARRRPRAAPDRHHHQAERRPVAGGDCRPGG